MQTYTDAPKNDRFYIRVDSHSKELLKKASHYAHKKMSEFVLSHALEAAEEVIKEHDVMTLSNNDWDIFYDALTTPPEPNAKLKQAMKQHRKRND